MAHATAQDYDDHALDFEIVIIGAGFSGIGAGIRLLKHGFGDFVILEKAESAGGTWRDNTYPGLAVDVPTLSYSYSFEQNPNWSNLYAPGPELKAYADHCVNKYGVRPHMRYGIEVTKTVYDEARNVWVTHTTNGQTFTSRYIVSATGFLTLPKMPDVPGLEKFKGKIIHTSRWDHSYDFRGKKVGWIGTGATSIQAIPEIADDVEHMDVYQRTPIWLLPKSDMPIPPRLQNIFANVPGAQRLARILTVVMTDVLMINLLVFNKYFGKAGKWIENICINHIKKQVTDPAIAEKLIPKYDFGCKRPSFTNKFYPVFNKPNVDLVTDTITEITENGIVTKDGTERKIDTLVAATGFQVFEKGSVPTFAIIGKGGVAISDWWEENRYQAFEGATVPGYPNYFMMFGPYSVCTASFFGMIDTQSMHLVRCLKEARRRKANYVEVTKAANDANFAKVQKRMHTTIFNAGDCKASNSYYFDRHGDNPIIRPVTGVEMWIKSRIFSMRNYSFDSK